MLPHPQVWNTNGVEGVYRFLARAWRLFADGVTDAAPERDQLRLVHLTIKRVRGSVLEHVGSLCRS